MYRIVYQLMKSQSVFHLFVNPGMNS